MESPHIERTLEKVYTSEASPLVAYIDNINPPYTIALEAPPDRTVRGDMDRTWEGPTSVTCSCSCSYDVLLHTEQRLYSHVFLFSRSSLTNNRI